MSDPGTAWVDAPSLVTVSPTAAGHHCLSMSAYLSAGRCAEPSDATGSADVFVELLRMSPAGTMFDIRVDDFAVTWSLNALPDEGTAVLSLLTESLGKLLVFDPASASHADQFLRARRCALAKARARLRSRSWTVETVLRQWTYHDDPYFSQPPARRVAGLENLDPHTFARFVTDVVSSGRLFLAVCGPQLPALAPLLTELAAVWPGTVDRRPTGPTPADAYRARRFGDTSASSTSYVGVSLPTVPRNDSRYRLAALCSAILGAADGPLMRQLRHGHGCLYRVEARAVPRPGSGDLVVKAEVARDTAEICLDTMQEALHTLGQQTVDPAFLEAIKARMVIRIRHALSTNSGRAAETVSRHFYGLRPIDLESIERGVRDITVDELRDFVDRSTPFGPSSAII